MDLLMETHFKLWPLFQILLEKSRTKRLIPQCQRLILMKLTNQPMSQFKYGLWMKLINLFHPLSKSISYLIIIMLQQLILVQIYFCDLKIIMHKPKSYLLGTEKKYQNRNYLLKTTRLKQFITKNLKLKIQIIFVMKSNLIGLTEQQWMIIKLQEIRCLQQKKPDHFTLFTSFQHKIRLQQNEIEILKQQVQQRIAENLKILKINFNFMKKKQIVCKHFWMMLYQEDLSQRKIKSQVIWEINRLNLLNDDLLRELEKIQIIVKKLQEQLMKGNQQFYKKWLNQNENQNDDIKIIQHQFNSQLQEKDKKLLELTKTQQQNQIKLNSYMQIVDQLNSQLQAKQNVMQQSKLKMIKQRKNLNTQKINQENNKKALMNQQQKSNNCKQLITNRIITLQTLRKIRIRIIKQNNQKSLSIIKSISLFDYYQQPKELLKKEKIEKSSQKQLTVQKLHNIQLILKSLIQKYDFEYWCEFIINDMLEEQKYINYVKNNIEDHKPLSQNSSIQEQFLEIKQENNFRDCFRLFIFTLNQQKQQSTTQLIKLKELGRT
ncbi:unnamed protein product [Paramecium sonneborni]|uniref:Uncharacterized protein n=1 Tax=Paramecium sonneborni TaxID=65129 RepID=A0A8S1LQV7_9CILI|nr:unnamed protein product [Paramecium sonneborni]